MSDIIVYPNEIADGLESIVKASHSIAWACDLIPIEPKQEFFDRVRNVAKAGTPDNSLFFYDSIYVSTGQNLNTDVFLPEELWLARATPVNKPVNREHDGDDIIGHMIDSVPVTDDMQIIPDTTELDQLPTSFSLQATSVVYRLWEKRDKEREIAKLIDEMKDGKWSVSMEAHFADFDYLLSNDSEFKVVARNENTSFLTKHLRRYGGSGVYEQYTIGRVLRKITFSGKGIVKKPANPKSKITGVSASAEKPQYIEANIVEESNGMADQSIDTLKQELDKARADLKAEKEAKASLESKIREQNAKAHEDEVKKLQSAIAEKEAAVTTATVEVAEVKAKLADIESKLTAATKRADEAEAAKAESDKRWVTKSRIESLVSAGRSEEDAKSLVAQFADLSNDQFKALSEVISSAKKEDKSKTKCEDDMEEDDSEKKAKCSASAGSDLLDNADLSKDASLSNESETTSAGTVETRQKLGKIFNNILNKTRASVIEDKE